MRRRSIRATPRQFLLQPLDVAKQAPGRELKEIEAEPRILEIELLHLAVADGERVAVREALEGLRAALVGRQQSELADELAGLHLDADLVKAKAAGDHI